MKTLLTILGGILGLAILVPVAVVGGIVLWVFADLTLGALWGIRVPLWVIGPLAVVAGVAIVASYWGEGEHGRH